MQCSCAGLNAACLPCFDLIQRCVPCSPSHGCQLALASAPQHNLCSQARYCTQSQDPATGSNTRAELTSAAICVHTIVHRSSLCRQPVSAASVFGSAAPFPNISAGSNQGNSMSSALISPGQTSQTPPLPPPPLSPVSHPNLPPSVCRHACRGPDLPDCCAPGRGLSDDLRGYVSGHCCHRAVEYGGLGSRVPPAAQGAGLVLSPQVGRRLEVRTGSACVLCGRRTGCPITAGGHAAGVAASAQWDAAALAPRAACCTRHSPFLHGLELIRLPARSYAACCSGRSALQLASGCSLRQGAGCHAPDNRQECLLLGAFIWVPQLSH